MKQKFFAAGLITAGLLAAGCSSTKSPSITAVTSGGVTVPVADGTPVSITASDQSETAQSFALAPKSVKAGKTTFTFVNGGNRKHEMIILKTDTAFDKFVVDASGKVSEDASVGEISETEAGATVVKSFDLTPGAYVLVCNIEKHYAQGMKVAFTVTP